MGTSVGFRWGALPVNSPCLLEDAEMPSEGTSFKKLGEGGEGSGPWVGLRAHAQALRTLFPRGLPGAGTGSRFFAQHISEEDGVLEAPWAQLAGDVCMCWVGTASLKAASD